MCRTLVAGLALCLLTGCAEPAERVVYLYPDQGGQLRDSAGYGVPDALLPLPDAQGPDSFLPDLRREDVAPGPDDATDAGRPRDVPVVPDLPDLVVAPDIPMPVDAAEDVPEEPDFVLPDPTDDCDPLGIPERWEGTFDGDIDSNVPDLGNYTFRGPVYGDVRFEIRCVNQKFMVFGELDGGADNCALANGCPFTARMEGLFNPETGEMAGSLRNGTIDFVMVVVEAEGDFSGLLSPGPALAGEWSGEKTGITPPALSWVTATGEGTWEAQPE